MGPGCTNLTEAARWVHQLKINGYLATATIASMKFKWIVDGYGWEIKFDRAFNQVQYFGPHNRISTNWLALTLTLLSEPRDSDVTPSLSCWLVDPSGDQDPSEETAITQVFNDPQALFGWAGIAA
ncbi:unnamed protein product [Urochloa humidicola]